VRSQTNLESQRQLHLVSGFSQTFDCFRNFRRVLDGFVNRAADLANYLFCVVINFHFAGMLRQTRKIANCQLSLADLFFAASAEA
jgi:hypothetical protein